MQTTLRIIAISGSLRRLSYNTAALEAAAELAPAHLAIERIGLRDIPMFDPDLFDEEGFPPSVARLREAIAAADGLLIASPEYNHSVTASLKNALDWTSRKPASLAGKPVGILSAATSPMGGSRGQYHLRNILQSLDAHVMPMPEMIVGRAKSKFDATGALADPETREALAGFVAAFSAYALRARSAAAV